MKSWKVTSQVLMEDEDNGEQTMQTVVTFVRAKTKQEAKKAGLKSIIHMPGVISVDPVEAVADDDRYYDGTSADPEVS